MSSIPITFSSDTMLLTYAEKILKAKIDSLNNDLDCCFNPPSLPGKKTQIALFPPLLFSFSVVDMLGAMYAGEAGKRSDTTANARQYMQKFISQYLDMSAKNGDWKLRLLQDIYRHKMVHLAGPKPVVLYENMVLGWEINEVADKRHMQVDKSASGTTATVMDIYQVTIDGKFVISIPIFAEDIRKSVFDPGGYLEYLKNDKDGRFNFVIAINQICNPVT